MDESDTALPQPDPSFIAPGMVLADPVVLPPDPKPDPAPDIFASLEPAPPLTARDKLRAFEDDVFGKDASRINGDVERGIGSPYADMSPHQKVHYASLEHLVKAEKAAADASAALADAEAKHEAAVKASAAAAQALAETA